ncbi:MAG: hypothetical protein H6811_09855 [Phycisphaeraceae bacterium]|nr:hypothetical protein [Phycisphaeraceae bacterium]
MIRLAGILMALVLCAAPAGLLSGCERSVNDTPEKALRDLHGRLRGGSRERVLAMHPPDARELWKRSTAIGEHEGSKKRDRAQTFVAERLGEASGEAFTEVAQGHMTARLFGDPDVMMLLAQGGSGMKSPSAVMDFANKPFDMERYRVVQDGTTAQVFVDERPLCDLQKVDGRWYLGKPMTAEALAQNMRAMDALEEALTALGRASDRLYDEVSSGRVTAENLRERFREVLREG